MSYKSTDIPVLLFPLKIEARFIGIQPKQLWIRVFPDEAFLQSHNPALTSEERADAFFFKTLTDEQLKRTTWNELVSKYGTYRAAYLVQIDVDSLEDQANNPELYEVTANVDAEFYYKGLPEQLVAYLYPTLEDKPLRVEGNIITERDRLLIFKEKDIATDDKNWLTNFDVARDQGMAFVVENELLGSYEKFERIIVTGFYYRNKDNENPTKSANALKELLDNHLYTEGLSFLNYGTPTNNLGNEASAYSVKDEFDAESSFDSMVQGYSKDALEGAVGLNLAYGLGIGTSDFKYFKNADLKESNFAYHFQKLTWFALGGEHLQKLLGSTISSTAHEQLWLHYSEYVRARGTYPCIKIGNQPYGILPVGRTQEMLTVENITSIIGDQPTNDTVIMKTCLVIALLVREWNKMVHSNANHSIPNIEDSDDVHKEIQAILSMQPSSSSLQLRTLAYDKIKGKLPKWLQDVAKIPTSLELLPVGQVYDILQNRTEAGLNLKFDSIQKDTQKILDLFSKVLEKVDREGEYYGFLNQPKEKKHLLHSPLLNLGNIGSSSFDGLNMTIQQEELENLELFFKQLEQDANKITSSGKLDRDISYAYEEIDQDNNTVKHTINTELFLYKGETSLFSDLLLRSFSNAIALYNRTIYFQPSNEDLVGITSYQVKTVKKMEGDSVSTNNIILEVSANRLNGTTKKITIKSPFKGIIQKSCIHIEKEEEEDTYYGICIKEGDLIRPGQALFKVCDVESYQRILKEYAKSGLALIEAWKTTEEHEQLKAIREIIDLNSYRLDAWASSLANTRLKEMRQKKSSGIYFGAYGWLENLEKDTKRIVKKTTMLDENRDDEGGIIHCPSPAQSLTATIFKNSYLSHEDKEEISNPFTLNLTSDRIQKSERFMEGIRQDQPIEALLGYQLERMLHDQGLNAEIYVLREMYPLDVNIINRADNNPNVGFKQLSVIDGLKIIEAKRKNLLPSSLNGTSDKVIACVAQLEDTLDGSLDHLFFEAGFQLTQRNLSQSAAAMDAAKGTIAPPITDSLKTKIPGVGIQHKLVYIFPTPTKNYTVDTCKPFIEPAIEEWLKVQLGDFKKIGCIVELIDEDGEVKDINPIKLSELKISYQDFLYMSEHEVADGASELEMYIINKLPVFDTKLTYRITEQAPEGCQPLAQALEVARYIFQLLSKSRGIKIADIVQEEEYEQAWESLNKIKSQRFVPLLRELKKWKNNPNTYNEQLAKLAITEAIRAWITKTDIDLIKLEQEITQLITKLEAALADFDDKSEAKVDFYQTFQVLEQAAKILFGKAFILLPPVAIAANLNMLLSDEVQDRLIGNNVLVGDNLWGQERIQTWIQELAQVKENVENFEEWQMVKNAWKDSSDQASKYQIVQFPTGISYPWLGLSKHEIRDLLESFVYENVEVYKAPDENTPYPVDGQEYYPDGSDCLVLYSDTTIDFNQTQFGIVIEEFVEHIPDERLDTGLSFHYNGPNSESPQALLLAVSSPLSRDSDSWNEDKLRDIIYDTMDLMKIRLIDLDAMQDYGYILPMTNLMHIPTVN